MSATFVLIFTVVFVAGGIAGAVLSLHHGSGTGKSDPNEGKPSRAELKRQLGEKAIRTKAVHIRPSLQDRKGVHLDDLSLSLGVRVDRGWPRQVLRAHLEDSHIKIGVPGGGKTIDLKRDIVTFPGAVVASSTKYDILEHVRDRRERRTGGRVFIFNPDRLGGQSSTLRWNPVMGCEDPGVAVERAAYFLSGTKKGSGRGADRDFWDSQANKLLRAFLLVAAHHHLDLFQVKRWANSPSQAGHAAEMLRQLAAKPDIEVPVQWADEMEQILGSYEKFTGSVFNTLSLAFDFLRADCEVARIVTLDEGKANFDAERFLAKRGTLFLLAEKRDFGSIAPLFCALAGYIYETARRMAGGRRLDPPVLFALDEAPNIVPLPLHDMTPQARGRGITFITCIQTYKQLDDTWG
jgi:type IV secretion system protein VirD4